MSLTLISVGFLVFAHFRPYEFQEDIEASLFVDSNAQVAVDVPGYRFASDCATYTRFAFRENPALEKQWKWDERDPLNYKHRQPRSEAMVRELVEYIVLERLSMSLESYFSTRSGSEAVKLRTYKRNDIPDILLSNRFLELFSRPVDDRSGFRPQDGESDSGEVIAIYGEHYFHRFSLSLPEDSSISRSKDGIRISGPNLDLNISISYRGFLASNPWNFIERYLGGDYHQIDGLQTNFCFHATVKRRFTQRQRDLSQILWAESIVQNLVDHLDFPHFLETISWPAVSAIIDRTTQPDPLPAASDD